MTLLSEPADLSGLKSVTGPVFWPTDAGFTSESAAFNAAITHTPSLIVGATQTADVQAAVRFAADRRLPIAVQATGHGASRPFQSGVLVSTRRMNDVTVDAAAATATVGAGARWHQVLLAAARHGLAPLSGSSSDVGAVGYTVGGGLPVMGRTFGWAADRVLDAELVTADGAVRSIDAVAEPDLLWAVAGGKGNVGIVTAMTIGLVAVTTVYGGGIFYGAEHIETVLHSYVDWAATMPKQMSTSVAIVRLPSAPQLPESIRGRTVAHVRVCHVGDRREGEHLVAPIRAAAPALIDHVRDMPYTEVDTIHADPDHPVPFCQRGALLEDLTHETVDALLGVAGAQVHEPLMVCELRQLGGALRDRPAAGNAVSGRAAAYSLNAVGLLAPDTLLSGPAAVDAVIAAAVPWSTGGTLVNMHGFPGDEADRARAWEPETYQRLATLAHELDPAGLFHHEHAIGRA